MAGLFGGRGGGGDGGASEQLRMQSEQLKLQEERLNRERTEMAEKAMSSVRARRGGGLRALLSAERPDELGVTQTKLGGGS